MGPPDGDRPNSGQFRWRVTLGVIDELLALGLPPPGTSNLGGFIVTAGGLVFIGATHDSRFRAFDKDTGKELWVTKFDIAERVMKGLPGPS